MTRQVFAQMRVNPESSGMITEDQESLFGNEAFFRKPKKPGKKTGGVKFGNLSAETFIQRYYELF